MSPFKQNILQKKFKDLGACEEGCKLSLENNTQRYKINVLQILIQCFINAISRESILYGGKK